jgi:hypothetical protein
MTDQIRYLNKGQLQETLDKLGIRKTHLSDVKHTGKLKPIDKATVRKIEKGESVNPSTIERLQSLLEHMSGQRVNFNEGFQAINDYVIEPHWPLETGKIIAGESADIAALVSMLSKSVKFEYELCLERITDTQQNSLLKLIEAIKLLREPRETSEFSSPEDNLIGQINRLKDIEKLSALTGVLISSGIKIFSCKYSIGKIKEEDAYLDPYGEYPGLGHVYSEDKRIILAFVPSKIESVSFHLHTGIAMPDEYDLRLDPTKYFHPDNSPVVEVIRLGDFGPEYELTEDDKVFKRGFGLLPDLEEIPF